MIVLVPEIALTPQTVARFQARFGDTVALLHSALSEGERYDEWRRLRSGEARIAVGPRSAVFAPVRDLGLVVVDEEHDSSYKHEGDPRYDARSVAAERARRSGAALLVGSATPRPETWRAFPHLRLPDRVDSRPLPPVRILDMRGAQHPLHPLTRRALQASAKSIVLLNRRGWSNFLTCRSCGKVWECPQCEVALVLHRAEHAIACHHCGHRERVPQRCDACGSLSVARYGVGTERIEAELAEALDVPVFRLDADTAATKDAVPELLGRFHAASAGVLLGTQMVAKGHDFPDVTLGVVLDADSTLRFPDFRAEERTFALIAQLAGRAGRGPQGGRVLVQTTAPDAPAIEAAAQHDTEGFLAGELERRRALRYPPFADLIRVVVSAVPAEPVRAAAAQVARGDRRRGGGAERDPRARAAVPAAGPRAPPGGRQDHRARGRDPRDSGSGRGRRARPRAARCGVLRGRRSAVATTTLDGSMAEEQTVQSEATEERTERLDPATRARRDAALRHVRVYGDPALRSRARPIEVFDDALADEVKRMGRLMDDALGIGLAATQLGVMHRLLVYRVDPEAALGVLINPEFEYRSDELETMEEGCLSLPGVGVEVERPLHVRVRASDETGAPVVVEASGLEARVIQHEIDHLDGVLILDRTSRDQRKQAMRAMREAMAGAPPDSSPAVSA